MDSIWNLWNYVEYVESTWNLWGSVKYTIQRTTKWNITKPRRKEEEQSESQTMYITKES